MKVTPQASFISRLRGSIGQLRFSLTGAGHVVRRAWTIRARATAAQAAHRQAVADARVLWLSMPGFLEHAWHLYAQGVEYSAYASWVHYNVAPIRDDQLTVLTPPNATYAPVSAVNFSAHDAGEISATWSYSGPPATCFVDIYTRRAGTLSWDLGAMCDAVDLADTIAGLVPDATYEAALTARDYPITRYQQSAHAWQAAGAIPYELLSAYTELDPQGQVEVTAYTASAVALDRTTDAWLYDDKGAAHFGAAFTHDFELTVTACTSGGAANCWSVSNVVDDDAAWDVADAEALTLGVRYVLAGARLFLFNRESGQSDIWDPISLGTHYYCTAERTAPATIAIRFYDDAARTNLLRTLTLPVNAARTYRYVFAVVSYTWPGAGTVSFLFENLDLHEP